MRAAISDYFTYCVTSTQELDGRVEVACKKGLWAVSAPDAETALAEARHYYTQYANDGEYKDIIAKKWRDGLGIKEAE
jgi:hypothetical protein